VNAAVTARTERKHHRVQANVVRLLNMTPSRPIEMVLGSLVMALVHVSSGQNSLQSQRRLGLSASLVSFRARAFSRI
jgi:hypothetical protein